MSVTPLRPDVAARYKSASERPPSPQANGGEISEDSIALQFAAEQVGRLRFDHTVGSWYVFEGAYWQRDERKLAFNYARDACRAFGDSKRTMGKSSTAAGVERFAQADVRLSAVSRTWDADPLLLGTPSCTVDLRTGHSRSADAKDGITKVTRAGPEPGAPELWLRFLNDACNGDAEMVSFLQRMCGYMLTGDTRESMLAFVHGPGGNGKSVFVSTLIRVLGDYAATAPMETFTASKFDRHPTDLAMLRGARMVTASETEEGRLWAEARIKQLTGGDPITARFMRQDFFTYQPQFKLLIVGNHAPRLHNVDEAMRRRFVIIPFVHRPAVVDRQLEVKLEAELGQILQWMIEGCLLWQRDGLPRPAVIRAATEAYFEDQDVFGQWLDECCDLGASESEGPAKLFESWREYARAAAEEPGSQKPSAPH